MRVSVLTFKIWASYFGPHSGQARMKPRKNVRDQDGARTEPGRPLPVFGINWVLEAQNSFSRSWFSRAGW